MKTQPERFFFDQDESSHWYMIPERLRGLWNEWEALPDAWDLVEGERETLRGKQDEFERTFEPHRLGGGITHFTFTDPQEEE